jgi:hypothetical protein
MRTTLTPSDARKCQNLRQERWPCCREATPAAESTRRFAGKCTEWGQSRRTCKSRRPAKRQAEEEHTLLAAARRCCTARTARLHVPVRCREYASVRDGPGLGSVLVVCAGAHWARAPGGHTSSPCGQLSGASRAAAPVSFRPPTGGPLRAAMCGQRGWVRRSRDVTKMVVDSQRLGWKEDKWI